LNVSFAFKLGDFSVFSANLRTKSGRELVNFPDKLNTAECWWANFA